MMSGIEYLAQASAPWISLYPPRASSFAWSVDSLYLYLIISTVSLAVLLAVLVITFMVRYRRRSEAVPPQIEGNNTFEFVWTGATALLFLSMFFWGSKVYFDLSMPPADAIEVFATGKQWMWKVQHPGGQREINELHIPVGQNVRLTLTSQDVIHSFFVPAFRVKQDVIPGRYTTLWFKATMPGRYHLFCAEYCGTNHSAMVGSVYAMEPQEYAEWLVAGGAEGSLASVGQKMYRQYGCSTCHYLEGQGHAPSFIGVFGSDVQLEDGRTVVADENYIRESILNPEAKVVLGYKPIMPTFQGQISEDNLLALIEYIKALGGGADVQRRGASAQAGRNRQE
jgi:cytochrome c oxidase subunit 2